MTAIAMAQVLTRILPVTCLTSSLRAISRLRCLLASLVSVMDHPNRLEAGLTRLDEAHANAARSCRSLTGETISTGPGRKTPVDRSRSHILQGTMRAPA